MATTGIDRDKLRAKLRLMGSEYIWYTLDRAIELLTPQQLEEIAASFVDVSQLRADRASPLSLVEATTALHEASIRGDYYEDFFVDSRNYRAQSAGTSAWISECLRLLQRCVDEKARNEEARACFELIFDLLRRVDACNEDIVFFADEGGSWQVGIDWDAVFPAWFECLAGTAQETEYARLTLDAIDDLDGANRGRHVEKAIACATPGQREALVNEQAARQRRRRLMPVAKKAVG